MVTANTLRSAIGVHHTATSDAAWDGPANEARLLADGTASYYRSAFAWADPNGDPETKAAYRFIHHQVSGSGDVGAAVMMACSTGIGVLNGGRGGTTIPAGDKSGVHAHLAAHMRDGNMEPPDMMRQAPGASSIERRFLPAEELRVLDAESGRQIVWYPAVFDSPSEDLGGFRETVNRRAFNKTLREADIRALFNHDPNFVLGRNKAGTLDISVTQKGLRATINPPDTQWANDLMTSIERGDINSGSFGFNVIKDAWRMDEQQNITRELLEVRLFDVSLVTFPAYPATEGVAARALSSLGISLDDLIHPLLVLRAGQPLDDEERDRYQSTIAKLREGIADPEPILPAVDHSIAAAARRRTLELLQLRGER